MNMCTALEIKWDNALTNFGFINCECFMFLRIDYGNCNAHCTFLQHRMGY